MYWNNFADFVAMGRYGLYVWGSVGMTALLMIVEPLLLAHNRKKLVARMKLHIRAETKDQAKGAAR